MQLRQVGHTEIQVSKIGLGTMTWGEQNTEREAHSQLDLALERGINLIDTAEMYPVPPRPETYTLTEQYIGSWKGLASKRDQIILASKIAGPGNGMPHVRGGLTRFNREMLHQAVDESLQRLNVDYLDLYQLHWPERETNFFGRRGYTYPPKDETLTPLLETLEALEEIRKDGKVRFFGLSNETPWGVMKYLSLAAKYHLPRMASIQNPYSLLNRTYEVGLAEITHHEDIGLLAYSPLAFGRLTGKYLGGATPKGARLTEFTRFSRYNSHETLVATEMYAEVAEKHGLSLTQMALAFVSSRPFVTSTLIGATNLKQLEENIASHELELSLECLQDIEAVHKKVPNPAP